MRGLLIGRFQPFHGGHLEVVRKIRAERPGAPLVIGVGTAEESFTWENPFTAGERLEMIDRALAEAKISGVLLVPVPDISRHAMWVNYLEALLPTFDHVYTNNPLTRLLFERSGYLVESPPVFERERFEGVRIREQLATDGDWKRAVPPAVGAYLEEIGAPARLQVLQAASGRFGRGHA
ncbi:MAG: nicotinamide-nucleotide adenylyltransferase [Thermoplasmata archaeon]